MEKDNRLWIACPVIMAFVFCLTTFANSNESRENTLTGRVIALTDAEFLKQAAEGNMFEIKAGELALIKASSPAVKKFAQRMVDDHTVALKELRDLAKTKNINLPEALSGKMLENYEMLSSKDGNAFDHAYMDLMVDDHKKNIAAYQKITEKTTDTDISTWANAKLKTLKEHLMMSQTTRDAIR